MKSVVVEIEPFIIGVGVTAAKNVGVRYPPAFLRDALAHPTNPRQIDCTPEQAREFAAAVIIAADLIAPLEKTDNGN